MDERPLFGPGRPSIAVVGSGPAGCYTAQFLRRSLPHAEIVVLDRLAVPYGLARFGVAPDHSGTRAVARQFDRLFEHDSVQFLGSVEVGGVLPLEALRDAFDIVILAVGLAGDRALPVPGADLRGVIGAGRLTRFVNGHPDECDAVDDIGERVVVVGHGNVAIDVIRMLLKPDLAAETGIAVSTWRTCVESVSHIDVVGRSATTHAKFDAVMLRELAKLSGVRFVVHGHEDGPAPADAAQAARREAVALLAATEGGPEPRATVKLWFASTPVRIDGDDRVRSVTVRTADGDEMLPADSVITAIGFEDAETATVRRAQFPVGNAAPDGRLAHGLYGVGWFRRGPRGTIPENRVDAKQVAEAIVSDVLAGRVPAGRPGSAGLPSPVLRAATDHPLKGEKVSL